MKYLITLLVFLGLSANFNLAYAASGVGDSGSNLYKSGKKLVIKAKKLEEKDKIEKAEKLYLKALGKLEKAYEKDKKNADILNYLGFALRKTGNFEKAEVYYLKGRIELAKERLQILNGCKCEEYEELKELIEKN